MEYNNYYNQQAANPPPIQIGAGSGNGGVGSSGGVNTNSNTGSMMSSPQQSSHQVMHSPLPRNARQNIPPGLPNHQHLQQQQHMPQQNYHQAHPSHGPLLSHSSSPHPQHQHHNQISNMTGPLPQQSMGVQAIQSQSPHQHGHLPPHVQPMVRPTIGPPVINHHQPGPNQPPTHHHQQNFFTGGGPGPHSNIHYHQQNQQHHPQHQPVQHHIPHQHQPSVLHHGPPPLSHYPHFMQQSIGRNSPYYFNILQTEHRMIEFNRKLQQRPMRSSSTYPIPSHLDEYSVWWDRFISDFFEDDATITLRLSVDEKPVEFTIGRPLIPKYFRTYFEGGVADLSIQLKNPREAYLHPNMVTLDCDQALMVTNNIFKFQGIPTSGCVVVHSEGHLIIDFVSNNFDSLSIKSWKFYCRRSSEYVDRAVLNQLAVPTNYFNEPFTKQGLTKSTVSYLKMCMIMEPMQEIMYQHKQTKMDPRSCLKHILFERFKFRSGEDSRAATNKRRKRKPSAAPPINTPANNNNNSNNNNNNSSNNNNNNIGSNKKSKTVANNSMGTTGLNNNLIMSPSPMQTSFSLASQDVMVVGEPSMMGGDFGDDNERMITRLENTQYDPSANADVTEVVPGSVANLEDSVDGNIPVESTQNQSLPSVDQDTSLDEKPRSIDKICASSPTTQEIAPASQSDVDLPAETNLHTEHPNDSQQEQSEQEKEQQKQQENDPSPIEDIKSSIDHIEATRTNTTELEKRSLSPMLTGVDPDVLENGEVTKSEVHIDSQSSPSKEDSINELKGNACAAENPPEQNTINSQAGSQDSKPYAPTNSSPDIKQISPTSEEDNNLNSDNVEMKSDTDVMTTTNSIPVEHDDAKLNTNVDVVEEGENYSTGLIQNLNDESNSNSNSNSNSQLACSTAEAAPAMEKQQPVDNGVA